MSGQTATPVPSFEATGILSTASLSTAVSPGMVILIRGANLSTTTAEVGATPLPATIGGTQVLVDDRAIPLISVSPSEVVAQLPWDIAPGQRVYVVRSGRNESRRVTAPILRSAPIILTSDGTRAMFQNADGSLNGDNTPAPSGSLGVLYAAGIGPVDARITSGAVNPAGRATLPVTVEMGGVRADNVIAELVPGLLGVYRIQFRVPSIGYGAFYMRLQVDGGVSNAAEIVVTPTTALSPDLPVCSRAILQNGQVQVPVGATEVRFEDEDELTGPVHSLYPNLNTGDERFYHDLVSDREGCPLTVESGVMPPRPHDPNEEVLPAEEAIQEWMGLASEFVTTFTRRLPTTQDGSQIVRIVPDGFVYQRPADPCLPVPGRPLSRFCEELNLSPFSGKDVIYVHGFNERQLFEMLDPGNFRFPRWTEARTLAYMNQFQGHADNMWKDQIFQYLQGKKNRYLTVGWSTGERLEYAVNTTLYQIANAIRSGARVRAMDNDDPRGVGGFCARGCVIISHSTGGLIVDVAMAKAADLNYQQQVGNIGFIPDRITTHVAIAGAVNGSGLATVAIAAAGLTTPPWTPVCVLLDRLLDAAPGGPCGGAEWLTSVLVDLIPSYAESVWRQWVVRSKVPVLTVSGAASYDRYAGGLNRFIHPGFDDNVVTTDSSCARETLQPAAPAGTQPFFRFSQWDRGMFESQPWSSRSFLYWDEQMVLSSAVASSGCTPYKTPWGMLFNPISWLHSGPNTFLLNHYSFIQTANFHRAMRDLTEFGREDVRAIKDNTVYALNLVKTDMRSQQMQSTRGRKITFRLFGKRHTWYLWRRTYHRLLGWESQPSAYYIYQFVQ
ncbi:MAG: hypothetical protein JNL98_12675 [Bryobacterales bacterium]|nr:hypothetical protein [Bryobacterales bacterium]